MAFVPRAEPIRIDPPQVVEVPGAAAAGGGVATATEVPVGDAGAAVSVPVDGAGGAAADDAGGVAELPTGNSERCCGAPQKSQ
ncbi:hypothetical protein SAMN05421595_2281 [Austwickia chelonae]|nr:hypothetical protein SAMN05421595_2281 [Austwickia chelonae]